LPARPVLMTFDDGYRTVFTLARSILERYAIPAVLFVCSDPVAKRRLLWYDSVARARGEAEVERSKLLPFKEWERLRSNCPLADEADPNAPVSAAEVKILADGLFEIGGHTAAHPVLARGDREQQRLEISRNKAALEGWSGRPVRAFAYPHGRPSVDYTVDTVTLLGESGFDFAFTTRDGFATSSEPPLERSRFVMLAGVSPAELAHRLCYSWHRCAHASA
jgi:peptidoglycan/xylan/chitin deacetylase (PgdA/CDA1 family)